MLLVEQIQFIKNVKKPQWLLPSGIVDYTLEDRKAGVHQLNNQYMLFIHKMFSSKRVDEYYEC